MHSYLQRVQKAIDDAVCDLSLEQLAWRREGKWSAADILEHLSLSYSGTAKAMQRCIQAGRPSATAPTWRDRMFTFVVTGMRYMPSGRQAPSMVIPQGVAPATVLTEMQRNLAAADDAISRCEAQFGTRTMVANHPILGPLTAQQWRILHLVHARHHMKQIARIREEIAAATKSAARLA
ncbi:MAG TPA: DUF1569 domain-containing protein [Terriglobales bacterium]|nr:DUF1569 domain-containing protein [Terriglobales bacterium]